MKCARTQEEAANKAAILEFRGVTVQKCGCIHVHKVLH